MNLMICSHENKSGLFDGGTYLKSKLKNMALTHIQAC